MFGGAGRDIMRGGTGNDQFGILKSTDAVASEIYDGGAGIDLIRDFRQSSDPNRSVSVNLSTSTLTSIEELSSFLSEVKLTAAQIIKFTRLEALTITATTAGVVDLTGKTVNVSTFNLANGSNTFDLSGIIFPLNQHTSTINGAIGNDIITGSDYAIDDGAFDQLNGNGGNDTLFDGPQHDKLVGGLGTDTLVVRKAGDFKFASNDLIDGTAEAGTTDTLRIDDAAAYELRNIQNIDRLLLNENAAGFALEIPTVMNNSADFNRDGTLGDLKIESAVVMTHGIAITTTVLFNIGSIIVAGSNLSGADVINGAGNKDIIDAGAGNDIITGNDGGDILTGGTGDDIFVYRFASQSKEDPGGFDRITSANQVSPDFGATDRLDFSDLFGLTQDKTIILSKPGGAYVTADTNNFFEDGIFRRAVAVQSDGNTTRVYGDTNGDGDYFKGGANGDLMIEFKGNVIANLNSVSDYIFI